MNIVSKRWDYFMPMQYVIGKDPLVELRIPERINNATDPIIHTIDAHQNKLNAFMYNMLYFCRGDKFNDASSEFKYISFCGRLYVVLSKYTKVDNNYQITPRGNLHLNDTSHITTFQGNFFTSLINHSIYTDADKMYKDVVDYFDMRKRYSTNANGFVREGFTNGTEVLPELIELSKKVGFPYFEMYCSRFPVYGGNAEYSINPIVPNLVELGFEEVLDAQSCFVELEQFLVNVLKQNPDTQVPVTLSDYMKIEKHGFDIKKSFRHRV